MLGCQPYGGGLWHTWFDRDLSLAGRCIVARRDGAAAAPGAAPRLSHELVQIDRPIARISSLAIHLDRTVNEKGFVFNLQTQAAPLLATAVKAALERPVASGEPADEKKKEKEKAAAAPPGRAAGGADVRQQPAHHPLLLELLAEQLQCRPEDILDFELCVCDTQVRPGLLDGGGRGRGAGT